MLSYDKLFSRALNKIDDIKELSLNENDLREIYVERLHSVVGKPRVRRIFSTLSLDDEIQTITFELRHPVDDDSDNDFVLELFSIGLVIEWLQPKVDSFKNTAKMFGGKEEKMLQNNFKPVKERLSELKLELNKMIRDYGYMYNSYLTGDS